MYIRGVEVDLSIVQRATPDWRHTKWDISHQVPMFDFTPHPGTTNNFKLFTYSQIVAIQQLDVVVKEKSPTQKFASVLQAIKQASVNSEVSMLLTIRTTVKSPTHAAKLTLCRIFGVKKFTNNYVSNFSVFSLCTYLDGDEAHLLMTICHIDGSWSDNSSDCSQTNTENCSKPNDDMKASQQIGFRVFEGPDQQVSIWDHIEWDKAPRQHVQGKTQILFNAGTLSNLLLHSKSGSIKVFISKV